MSGAWWLGSEMTGINSGATQKISKDVPPFCPRIENKTVFSVTPSLYLHPTLTLVFYSVWYTSWGGRAGRQAKGHRVSRGFGDGTELILTQTMARYGPCILRNWMMKEGPPATIWGGRWVRGQFSMLMMDSLLQRASSNGRLCRLGLSLRYSSSKFSSVPTDRNSQLNLPQNKKAPKTIDRCLLNANIYTWKNLQIYFMHPKACHNQQ